MRNIILSFIVIFMVIFKNTNAQDIKLVDIKLNNIVYVASEDRIYGTLSGQYPNGNSLVIINPYTGNIEKYYQIGSQPNKMTISKDGKYIYIGLDAQNKINRFNVKEKKIDNSFIIGIDEYGNPETLEDIHEFPLDSTILICLLYKNYGTREIALFKNGVKLSKTLSSYGFTSVTVNKDGRIFTYDNQNNYDGFMELEVKENGIQIKRKYADIIQRYDSRLQSNENYVYTNFGKFINISDTIAYVDGICDIETYNRTECVIAPDTNIIYFINRGVLGNLKITSINLNNYSYIENFEIPYIDGEPSEIISWGSNKKLAIIYGNKLIITRKCTSLLKPPYNIPVSNYGGCYNDLIQISAPEGYSYYLWSTGETTQNISVINSGKYYFRLADTLGCLADTSFLVNVTLDYKPSQPSFEGNGYYSICHGQSITLTPYYAYSEYRYLWSTGETTQSIKVNQPGNYYLSFITKNNCKSDISNILTVTQINDTVPPKPKIKDLEFNSICYGSTIFLEAPEGYNYYLWNTGANTQIISTTYSGNFTVKVANNQQCFSEYSEPIYLNYASTPVKPYILSNDNLLASSAPIGNQWFFNGQKMIGDTSQFLNATKNGFYTVQVTINGCKSMMSDLFNFKLVSLLSEEIENKVFIYPNPVNDELNLIIPSEIAINKYEIINAKGQTVLTCNKAEDIHTINLPSGVYVLRLFDENKKRFINKRFIKIN